MLPRHGHAPRRDDHAYRRINDLAMACKSTDCEVLSHLGHRFQRIYHVT